MELFEKNQRIDVIQGMVKARWFGIVIVVGLGFILKLGYFSWAPTFDFLKIAAFSFFAFGCNFAYWLFIRRPIEKIGDRGLEAVAVLQVVLDQLMYTFMFYYAGTVEGITLVLFFITIFIASSLFKTKGVILSGVLASTLVSGVILAEYYRLIPHVYAYKGANLFGNPLVTRGKIISFIAYMGVAVIFSVLISNLIRRREKGMLDRQNKLVEQSQILIQQTQEITQTKDWLHDSLAKSDKARNELEKIREELEKTNAELKAKINELEKYGQVTTGRELKMVELKNQIKDLQERIAQLEKSSA